MCVCARVLGVKGYTPRMKLTDEGFHLPAVCYLLSAATMTQHLVHVVGVCLGEVVHTYQQDDLRPHVLEGQALFLIRVGHGNLWNMHGR